MRRRDTNEAVSNVLGYTFAFSIASLIMISSVIITTSLIDEKTYDAVGVKAQSIANQVADVLITAISIKQSMPDAVYSKTLDVPTTLIGLDYYIELTDTAVYVNTTDGRISRSCTNYNTKNLDFGIRGKVSSQYGGVTVSYKKPRFVYKLDFGIGNITDHSPVSMGYYHVSNLSYLNSTERQPAWLDNRYKYRIPIVINNTVPKDLSGKYYASNLTDTVVSIELTNRDIDYNMISLYVDPDTYSKTNCVFYDPGNGTLPYCIDNQRANENTVFLVNMSIHKNESKCIYLYYGAATELYHYNEDVSEFYDNFGDAGKTWNKSFDAAAGNDIAYSVSVDYSSNNVYVVGSGTNRAGINTKLDWWIKAFDVYGYEYKWYEGWNKTYDDLYQLDDEALSVAVDNTGYVYVVGYLTWINKITGLQHKDWCIKKFDRYGIEQTTGWNKRLGNFDGDDIAYSVTIDSSNNVIVAGTYYHSGQSTNYWIYKFYSNGNTYPNFPIEINGADNMDDVPYSITTDKDKNIYIVGYQGTNTGKDTWILKYGSGGGIPLLNILIPRPNNDEVAYSVVLDNKSVSNPNIYVVGYGTNLTTSSSGKDWWIKNFSSNGVENVAWRKNFSSPGNYDDIAYSVQTYINNTFVKFVYVAGTFYNSTDGSTNWGLKAFWGHNRTEINKSYYSSGWNKTFDAAHRDDAPQSMFFGYYGYVVGYGTNVTKKPYDTKKDWWIKKFFYYGTEITYGMSINTTVWHMSNVNKISSLNLGINGRARLQKMLWIVTNNYKIPPPLGSNESMYLVEMGLEVEAYSNRNNKVSMNFFGINNRTLNGSYGVSIDIDKFLHAHLNLSRYKDIPPPAMEWSKSVNIPPPVYKNDVSYVRLRSYVHTNLTATVINSYVYDDIESPKLFSPYEENCSFVETSTQRKNGTIAIFCPDGSANPPINVSVTWIRVLKVAPSYQPSYTIGAMESINYGWVDTIPGGISVDRNNFDPFSPDPVNRDFINILNNKKFGIYNINLKFLPTNRFVVTITVGDRTSPTSQSTLGWIVQNSTKPTMNFSGGPIQLPATKSGEFKRVWFTFEIPWNYSKGNIILNFTGISTNKAVSAITIEESVDIVSKPGGFSIKEKTEQGVEV